jgi:hypothetical protein
MPSILSKQALAGAACALLATLASSASTAESDKPLSCDTRKPEAALLRQSNGAARRTGKHVLALTTSKGQRRFADQPPYDTPGEKGAVGSMGEVGEVGVKRRYCGYDSGAKAYLVELIDGSTRTGELLFADSGRLVRAGYSVLFAPDRRRFLATEQDAGADGEHWRLVDADGKALWEGYAGTLTRVDGIESMVSTFDRPRWNAQGELTARYACLSGGAHGVVTLARSPAGTWAWRGHGKCG